MSALALRNLCGLPHALKLIKLLHISPSQQQWRWWVDGDVLSKGTKQGGGWKFASLSVATLKEIGLMRLCDHTVKQSVSPVDGDGPVHD